MLSSPFRSAACAKAFSLVELLTVVAIVAVLATAAGPMMSESGRAGNATKGLVEISGILEQARGYAVSRNTYVWVVFTANPVMVTAFASADGSSQGVGPGDTVAVPSSAFTQIEKLKTLENCRIADVLPPGSALESTGFSPAGENLSQGPRFNYSARGGIDFTRSVMFTPSGQARQGSVLPSKFQMVVVPTRGESIDDTANTSVIQVSGLTGRIKVYRP